MEIAVSTSPAHIMMTRKKNTWYSVRDGNWSDPNTWISNALDKRIVTMPRNGDDVYLHHNVLLDTSATINNLYIQGKLTSVSASLSLTVNGDLQANGSVDFTGSNTNLLLYGYNNFINAFTAGNSTVTYTRAGVQNVMPLTYYNVNILGSMGIKYLTTNTTVNSNLIVNGFAPGASSALECGSFDLTVVGNTTVTWASGNLNNNFSKSGSGSLLFKGLFTLNSNVNFSSNITNIEFRGGISGSPIGGSIIFNCPVSFTTNSQTLSISGTIFNNPVSISSAITINVTSTGVTFNDVVNGDNIGSTLTNNGYITLGTTIVPMNIGVFNWMAGAFSTIDYTFNDNYTLPYTAYKNLRIHGSGIKFLSGDTNVLNLNISDFQPPPDANLDCGSYNLTINGSFQISALSGGALLKTGAGNILFVGSAGWNTQSISYAANVTLEFRSGLTINSTAGTNSIDATVNFTTNSQTFSSPGNNQIINGNVIISDGITVSVSSNANGPVFNGILNGLGNDAILKMLAGTLTYNHATAPMTTGKLFCNQATNTFIYGLLGNQDIQTPADPTPGYKNLTLQGSGVKKLLGNISVKGAYTLSTPAALNLNGFALTNP